MLAIVPNKRTQRTMNLDRSFKIRKLVRRPPLNYTRKVGTLTDKGEKKVTEVILSRLMLF